MLFYRLKAALYLAFIIFLSVVINASKIPPETFGFVAFVSALAIGYAFLEPDLFIAR
jgi:hypothetical protein